MTRTTSTNFTGANSFPKADATTDPFLRQDMQQLAAAVDAHDHSTGKGLTAAGSSIPYVNIQDQKTSGTAGGGTTAGSWVQHALTTEVQDTANVATLTSNQIALLAGTYRTNFYAVGYATGVHQSRLQNVTDGTTLVLGISSQTNNAYAITSSSHGSGRFTLAAGKTLELQMRVGTNRASDGFGSPVGWGTEVYAVIEFFKEA